MCFENRQEIDVKEKNNKTTKKINSTSSFFICSQTSLRVVITDYNVSVKQYELHCKCELTFIYVIL